ncbi:uncharacterized protein LOC126454936 [Schistocerca serialis cubense]|uniref:uncharacterized protein LOC126454936 n=1 Tax=Schistocerca serialis cubense TaxID=2023355 RepID=UPI00214F5403|nr:uncharacterized protein LOC126454936 [Schistocerca serialis cubense]
MSFSYRVRISTVANIDEDICDALWQRLQPKFMPTPDEAMWRNNERGFKDKWNFPHCNGAIDGKHVAAQRPPHSGSRFYNYKQYHSVVLLGLIDADYMFIAIDSGSYGKECVGSIFTESALGQRICSYSTAVPPDEPIVEEGSNLSYVIVGDEGFPLKRFLLHSFPRDKRMTTEKRVYNYRVGG